MYTIFKDPLWRIFEALSQQLNGLEDTPMEETREELLDRLGSARDLALTVATAAARSGVNARELAIVRTKIEEAIMWLEHSARFA